jgi:hypothetical protein
MLFHKFVVELTFHRLLGNEVCGGYQRQKTMTNLQPVRRSIHSHPPAVVN